MVTKSIWSPTYGHRKNMVTKIFFVTIFLYFFILYLYLYKVLVTIFWWPYFSFGDHKFWWPYFSIPREEYGRKNIKYDHKIFFRDHIKKYGHQPKYGHKIWSPSQYGHQKSIFVTIFFRDHILVTIFFFECEKVNYMRTRDRRPLLPKKGVKYMASEKMQKSIFKES